MLENDKYLILNTLHTEHHRLNSIITAEWERAVYNVHCTVHTIHHTPIRQI